MNVFDIIGPIMVGPSSSHTAGAVRIGRTVRGLLGEQPTDVVIGLHGSFAKTYMGHGTDKAIIAGILGMSPSYERIRKSMELARESGMKYRFEIIMLEDAHPNTVLISAIGKSCKKVIVQGSSVGGGNIIIKRINGMNVEVTGEFYALVISHEDSPGVVAAVTNLLAWNEINIANMKVYRSCRGGDAMMVIETDQELRKELKECIEHLPKIKSVMLIEQI
jgi:L-serine dehydratase